MTAARTKSVLSAHSRASGNPGAAMSEREALGPRLRGDERVSGRRLVRAKPHRIVRQHLSYKARLKAAGLSDDDWDSLNEFVRARLRAMWRDDWHGCRLPMCRRHRGCMAPHLYCSNRASRAPDRCADGSGGPPA